MMVTPLQQVNPAPLLEGDRIVIRQVSTGLYSAKTLRGKTEINPNVPMTLAVGTLRPESLYYFARGIAKMLAAANAEVTPVGENRFVITTHVGHA